MGQLSKDQINVDLFDEVTRLKAEVARLQSEPMDFKFSMNDNVKIKLNDSGVAVLKARHDELNKMIHANGGKGLGEFSIKVDEEGYTRFQLWDLINTFGYLVGMGLESPFEIDMVFIKGKPVKEKTD